MRPIGYVKKYASALITILVITVVPFLSTLNFGVSKNNIEKDARKSQEIQADWITTSSINDDLGVFLFYSKEINLSTFSFYQKGNGFSSFGYNFRYGGSQPDIDQSILRVKTKNKGSALISLNKIKVAKIEIFIGIKKPEVITIDSEKPFTTILPKNYTKIEIYDVDGNLIPFENIIVNEI